MKRSIKLLLSIIIIIILQSCEITSTHYFKADGMRDIEESAYFLQESPNDEFKHLPENKWIDITEIEKGISPKISNRVFVKINRGKNGKPQRISFKSDNIKQNEIKKLQGFIEIELLGKWNGNRLIINKKDISYQDNYSTTDYILKFENKINDIKGKNDFITQLDEHTVRIFVKSEEIEKFNQENKKIIITTTKN